MAFGLGLGLMLSIVTMSSFTPGKKPPGLFRYTPPTQQAWNGPVSQNQSLYTSVSSTEDCNLSTDRICTYTISDSGVIAQSTKGTYTP